MRVIIFDNWEEQLKLIKDLFVDSGNEIITVKVDEKKTQDDLLNNLIEMLGNDTCFVFDLFLRIAEEKRRKDDIEECIAINVVRDLLNYISTQDLHYSNLRIFFMSGLIFAENNTVAKVDKLFGKNIYYVATLQKPIITTSENSFKLDESKFMGKLYQNNLESEYWTYSVKKLFVNMILHGLHARRV